MQFFKWNKNEKKKFWLLLIVRNVKFNYYNSLMTIKSKYDKIADDRVNYFNEFLKTDVSCNFDDRSKARFKIIIIQNSRLLQQSSFVIKVDTFVPPLSPPIRHRLIVHFVEEETRLTGHPQDRLNRPLNRPLSLANRAALASPLKPNRPPRCKPWTNGHLAGEDIDVLSSMGPLWGFVPRTNGRSTPSHPTIKGFPWFDSIEILITPPLKYRVDNLLVTRNWMDWF